MAASKEISAGGRSYTLHGIKGTVVGTGKISDTRSTTSGGNYNPNTGTYAPVSHHIHTDIHDQIFLRDPEGHEHAIKLVNWNVAVREGHEWSAFWAIQKGNTSGDYIAVMNRTVNENMFAESTIKQMCKPKFRGWVFLGVVICIFLAAKASLDNAFPGRSKWFWDDYSTPSFAYTLQVLVFKSFIALVIAFIIYKIVVSVKTNAGIKKVKQEVWDMNAGLNR